jgi:hypothetical protein
MHREPTSCWLSCQSLSNLSCAWEKRRKQQLRNQQYTAIGAKSITHLYSESPEPESHGIWDFRIEGFRSQRKHRLEERTNAIANRERTKPHTWLYVRFHLVARREASLFRAASHSTPINPSTENTKGVKCFLWRTQCSRYFFFFSSSWRDRITLDSIPRCEGHSVSVTRISNIALVPRDQNPCAETSPRISGKGSVRWTPAPLTCWP